MSNPYAPSDATVPVKSPTAVPAGLLLVLLVPTLLCDAWFVVVGVGMDLLNASSTSGWSFTMVREWGFILKLGMVCAAHVLILVGAIRMRQYRSYWLAVVACVLSLIPVLSPALVLGIPFGILGLIVLRREDVRAAFGNA